MQMALCLSHLVLKVNSAQQLVFCMSQTERTGRIVFRLLRLYMKTRKARQIPSPISVCNKRTLPWALWRGSVMAAGCYVAPDSRYFVSGNPYKSCLNSGKLDLVPKTFAGLCALSSCCSCSVLVSTAAEWDLIMYVEVFPRAPRLFRVGLLVTLEVLVWHICWTQGSDDEPPSLVTQYRLSPAPIFGLLTGETAELSLENFNVTSNQFSFFLTHESLLIQNTLKKILISEGEAGCSLLFFFFFSIFCL